MIRPAHLQTSRYNCLYLQTQHDLMVKRNTELHNLDQMCKAATDRITELTHLQREARNVRNALDRTDARFADVTEESKYDSIIERERAELKLRQPLPLAVCSTMLAK